MLKRQDSLLSSSRRQITAAAATPPSETHRAKAVGCMSGIFQLFSKYQNSNRRLTFGRIREKRKASSPTEARSSEEIKTHQNQIYDTDRLICGIKVPRSPTIPPEIRRSNSPDDSRTPSSLVARLMGLEDIRANNTEAFEEDLITKKRQRLVQALEKCNEDLEALKKIIKALQIGDVRLDRPPRGNSGSENTESLEVELWVKCTCEDDIPACAAAELNRSTVGVLQNTNCAVQVIPHQRKPTAAKKPGEDDELPIAKLLNKCTFTAVAESSLVLRQWVMAAQQQNSSNSSSRAMVKSVEEVCGDIAWGEKRETDRIGVALQDHLCRDLIEDLVNDMMIVINSCSSTSSTSYSSLPLEACKKRLRF